MPKVIGNQELEKKINKNLENKENTFVKYEKQRYQNKIMLKELLETWKMETEESPKILEDEEFSQIIKDIEKYASYDIAATHAFAMDRLGTNDNEYLVERTAYRHTHKYYGEEAQLFDIILKKLDAYFKKIDSDDSNYDVDEEKRTRYLMTANLLMYFEGQRDGHLEEAPENAVIVNETTIKMPSREKKEVSRLDEPLFPHDPSPNDLRQGELGNCYMMAALADIANTNPNAIKECMRDNGNGTVTVRFYQRLDPQDQTGEVKSHDVFKPIYVTVKKVTPDRAGAQNCLWASMIERAYAVAGLNISSVRMGGYTSPRPENLEERYQECKKLPKDQRPLHYEDPWVIDELGRMTKRTISYDTVIGGKVINVLGYVLGPTHEPSVSYNREIIAQGAKELIYQQMRRLVAKYSSSEFLTRLETAMGQMNLEEKKNNLILMASVLMDEKIEFDWESYEVKIGNNGNLKELPKSDFTELLQRYSDRFEVLTFNNKKTRYKMIYSLEKTVAAAYNYVEEKLENHEKERFAQLKSILEEDKSDLIQQHGNTYPESYVEVYDYIKKSIENRSYISVGTPLNPEGSGKRGDAKRKFGLYYKHAYSVLGVEEKVIDGKSYKFVVVRNPHGTTKGPDYDFSKNPPEPKDSRTVAREGIFLVELRHFVEGYRCIYHAEAIKEPVLREQNHPLTKKAAWNYNNIFTEMNKTWILKGSQLSFAGGIVTAHDTVTEELENILEILPLKIGRKIEDFPIDNLENALQSFQKEVKRQTVRTYRDLMDYSLKIEKVIKMLRNNMANPEMDIRDVISGGSLYEKSTIWELIKIYGENELQEGTVYSAKEAKKLDKLLSNVDPVGIGGSKEFDSMRKSVHELRDVAQKMKNERLPSNFNAYIEKLSQISEKCDAYLSYKRGQRGEDENHVIIAKTDREKLRIEAADKVKAYVTKKKEAVEKDYYKMLLAGAIYQNLEYEQQTDIKEKTKEILDLSYSKEFLKITEGVSLEELKISIQSKEQIQKYMKDYLAEIDCREIDRFCDRQITIFNEQLKDVKKNKEALKDTIAKMVYGQFCKNRNKEMGRDKIVKNENVFVKEIKKTEVFEQLIQNKCNKNLPNYLEQKEGVHLISECEKQVKELLRIHKGSEKEREQVVKEVLFV